MPIGKLLPARGRIVKVQVPVEGTLTPGEALTNFVLRTDVVGDLLPNGMEIRGIVVSHINPATQAAVSTISELILYCSSSRRAQDIVYEDKWGSIPAAERRLDNTWWNYMNVNNSNQIFGAARIKAGEAAAALVIQIAFV